jgi:two-component sensor histidine kinase
VSFGQYVRELTASLMRSYGAGAADIRVQVEMQDAALTIDTAIPCGLIVTELVSNSLKHAFPGGRGGEVAVSLQSDDQGEYCLTVRDNGVGLPPGLDPRESPSLGLQLVGTLAGQLRATLDVHGDAGTAFVLRFHELPPR